MIRWIRRKKRETKFSKLEHTVMNLMYKIDGGFATNGLANDIKQLDKLINDLRNRTSVLEEIVREAGLITDFDSDEVKIREDRKFDIFGGNHTVQVPYQINKVKVEK